MSKKLTFKEVKKYFKDHDCELKETEYINCSTLMRYRCDCGNKECKISFNNFKNGVRCMKCGTKKAAIKQSLIYKDVKQYFEDRDCELYETKYINSKTPMRYRCDCGNKECKISFSDFKRGGRCIKCSGKEKFIYKEVKKYFEEHDCKLLATEYTNNKTKMEYECSCGNPGEITFKRFKKGERCYECGIKKISGKNNWRYNSNLTDEERIIGRNYPEYIEWRKDV